MPESIVPAAPSLRETAGAMAPPSLASSSAPAVPHFEQRSAPAREIPGARGWAAYVNRDPRPPAEVLADLREARAYFGGLRDKGGQTAAGDGERTNKLINPILNAENARHPGLNAIGCGHEDKMAEVLRSLSAADGGGQEGHIRFHVGVWADFHRVAVDAYRHREGGFTLVAVDSLDEPIVARKLAELESKHPDIIKGTAVIPTPNQVHGEGCRIFGVHALNALYDFQPYVQGLHRQIRDKAQGLPAPRLSGPEWKRISGNTQVLADEKDAFGVLPGKFFKHIQVPKRKPGETRDLLDEAEARNPALTDQALNKKGQTLRDRFASRNPGKAPEDFSRADRTSSLDQKRLILIDRAIAHYEALVRAPGPNLESRSGLRRGGTDLNRRNANDMNVNRRNANDPNANRRNGNDLNLNRQNVNDPNPNRRNVNNPIVNPQNVNRPYMNR